ncbi:MAG: hypothetical protein J6S85_14230 [Methanobrevibacter sp.]|nr:hypothetical protein [Methanobrevibacter sp.]
MALKKLGDKVCVFDEDENKCLWFVVVGYNDRHDYLEYTSHYIIVQINKSVWEKDLKFEKIPINEVYDSEEKAKEAYIKELEEKRDKQNKLFNDRILKLKGGKKND